MTDDIDRIIDEAQELADTFYWSHGSCCAGCDHWEHLRAGRVGLCAKAAPVNQEERAAILGFRGASLSIGAGHPFTMRNFHCGDFKDDFDWLSLSPAYRARIGAPSRARLLEREVGEE